MGINIGAVAEIVGMFAVIVGGIWVLGRVMRRRAYDDGAHSKEHTNISEDITAAHNKIREHDIDIAELKKNSAVNAKEHEAILKGLAHSNTRLDKIYELLVAK
jgi:hypothetical protein